MTDSIENILKIGEALEERLGQLEDSLEEQINRVLDISRIGSVFTSYLDLNLILPMVIETGLRIVKGEVGEVTIFDFEGESKSISWGLSLNIVERIKSDGGETVIDRIIRTSETQILNALNFHARDLLGNHEINMNSLIVVPMITQQKIIGLISIANKEDSEGFTDEDKLALEMLGSFAAVAVQNAELHRDDLARQKLEHELELAEHVQSTLMPQKRTVFDDLEVNTYHDQAGQVGGDFYDIIVLGQGKYLIVVADVSNKGMSAALIMTSVRAYVRAEAEKMTSLAELASKVNNHLCRDMEQVGGMFVTMFYSLIDMDRHRLTSVNAGHPPGYLFRGNDIEMLKTGGTFIGQFTGLDYIEKETEIKVGDRLILYTDGIFECVNAKGEMLGLDKARKFFINYQKGGWNNFVENLKKLLKEYSFDISRVDDTTLLMIEIKR
jgi:sigma-B regulation protein RsbU (phosphoserine phosphatase)